MNNLHFIKGFNRIMLCNYSKDDLYVYKKAQMMLNVSIILLFAGVASTVGHYSIYALEPLMLVGDIILILGVILAIASIQRGKIVWAGTIAMVTAVLTALSQNVVGDICFPLY